MNLLFMQPTNEIHAPAFLMVMKDNRRGGATKLISSSPSWKPLTLLIQVRTQTDYNDFDEYESGNNQAAKELTWIKKGTFMQIESTYISKDEQMQTETDRLMGWIW